MCSSFFNFMWIILHVLIFLYVNVYMFISMYTYIYTHIHICIYVQGHRIWQTTKNQMKLGRQERFSLFRMHRSLLEVCIWIYMYTHLYTYIYMINSKKNQMKLGRQELFRSHRSFLRVEIFMYTWCVVGIIICNKKDLSQNFPLLEKR